VPHNYTINFKGEQQVAMKTTGYRKLRVTVMLCITTNGNKLPPYVILNRRTMPKENFCKDIIVQVQKNAWMTSELMEDWLGCVWECRPGELSKPQSMFAMDAFHGHLSVRIRNKLRNKNNDLVIIPSGMTSQLQPLDVLINKPFKHPLCKHYDTWLDKSNHIRTPSGKIKRASASIIVEWISKAWKEMPINIIPKLFLLFLILKMDHKMTLFMTKVNKVAGEHHCQKMEVWLKDHWTKFLIK
jgi:hypothetical protein